MEANKTKDKELYEFRLLSIELQDKINKINSKHINEITQRNKRINDLESELSELKAKHKECLDAVIKLNDYFFCEKPIDEGEYTDLIKLTEKVINKATK